MDGCLLKDMFSIVHVGWIIVFPPNCYSSTCSQHQFHCHFLLAVAPLPWNLVVNYRVFFINCSKIRGSKSLKDWVYEESFVLTFMVITNNFALNSNKGSKLDLIPIFNHVKQKLIIKKNHNSVQSELAVLDYLQNLFIWVFSLLLLNS